MRSLKQLLGGIQSLVTGLGVTLRNLFRRPVTWTYPHEKPELSPNFRSAIALIRFEETGSHDCVACLQCEKICPSFCIKIEGERPDGLKRKRPTRFDVDYALCSVCGLCLDVCPTETLKYSKVYDVAGYRRDSFVYDLIEEFRDGEEAYRARARAEAQAEAERKKKAKAAKAAADAADAPKTADA